MELLAEKVRLEEVDGFKAEKNPSRVYDISLLRPPEIVERDGRYVAYGNGVVCDCYTKQEWLVGPDRDTSWHEAGVWIESLNRSGGRWAMPSLALLRGLYRKNLRQDLLSPLFRIEPTDVWSCELRDDTSAWAFNFIPGNTFWTCRTLSRRFRAFAVRPRPEYSYPGK